MTSRRRRTGSRPEQLSDGLRAAIDAESSRLANIGDPVATIKAVNETLAGLDGASAELAAQRIRAVAQLRQLGWSLGKIAEATGLSRSRVQQLDDEGKRNVPED